MCGIVGFCYFESSRNVEENILNAMVRSLRHRGPDDLGQYIQNNIGLGHTRLSIIDLTSDGHQPMANQNQNRWITYNGEIYNFQELRQKLINKGYSFKSKTDTEVILNLFEEYGEKCVDHLDGMFAFVIYDETNKTLFAARDRLGIKPFYYLFDDEKFIFGSEIKSILEHPDVKRDINPKAIYQYFEFMSIQTPETIYQDIKKLEPAHTLTLEKGRLQKKCYWDIPVSNTNSQDTSPKKIEQDLLEQLHNSVKTHMVGDVPVGAFLSGGVDSSSVVALASSKTQKALDTFSVTFKEHESFDESPFALRVSRLFKTHHHEFEIKPNLIEDLPRMVWHCDEPFAISSAFALYLLSEQTTKHVKVVLSGDGGDEIFAGYPRHFKSRRLATTEFIPNTVRHSLNQGLRITSELLQLNFNSYPLSRVGDIWDQAVLPDDQYFQRQSAVYENRSLRSLFSEDFFHNTLRPIEKEADATIKYFFQARPEMDNVNRRLYVDLKTSLVDEMLTKVDRMTMAFGLEARVPLLDHHLVELAFQIPGSLKHKNGEGKFIFKKSMESLLPLDLLHRPKWGFNVPLKLWFQKDLSTFMHDRLMSSKTKNSGMFNNKTIELLLEDHRKQKTDNSNKLFEILVWDLWKEKFKV